MPLLNYSPNDQFIVEPNYISISSYSRGLLEAYIIIYNLEGKERTFNLTCTKNFISQLDSTVTVPYKGLKKIPVLMNTDRFASGTYRDYIDVRSGRDVEKVIIEIELLELKEIVRKAPTEEQPAQIGNNQAGKTTSEKAPEETGKLFLSPTKTIIIFLLGLAIMGVFVFLHIMSKTKTIKFH